MQNPTLQKYHILVSKHVTEDQYHPFALSSLREKQIILPQQQNHYPAQKALALHNAEVFTNKKLSLK